MVDGHFVCNRSKPTQTGDDDVKVPQGRNPEPEALYSKNPYTLVLFNVSVNRNTLAIQDGKRPNL